MLHNITSTSWRELFFVYVPVAYFALRGFLFETYRVTAWVLVHLCGVPPED